MEFAACRVRVDVPLQTLNGDVIATRLQIDVIARRDNNLKLHVKSVACLVQSLLRASELRLNFHIGGIVRDGDIQVLEEFPGAPVCLQLRGTLHPHRDGVTRRCLNVNRPEGHINPEASTGRNRKRLLNVLQRAFG